jgi:hypothetical protein
VALVLLTTGIALAITSSTSSSPSIWIDEPLDATNILLGTPVAVVGHVADVAGLEASRLEVDGVEIALSEVSVAPGALATLQFDWVPDVPGLYVLGMWAKPASGEWIGPALATVTVVGDLATTTTSTVSSSSTAPSTTTPTTSPTTVPSTVPTTVCTFETPQLVSPADNETISKTGIAISVPFSWSYSGCSPNDLLFHIQLANDPSFATGNIVWNATTSAKNATSVPIACSDYWWRVRVRAPVVGDWSTVNAFIVQDACTP